MNLNRAFPKIWAIGSPEIVNLFEGSVEVTEKIDGSQLGFGKDMDGNIVIRSKNKELYVGDFDKMFKKGVDYILSIQNFIPAGHMFYGEYLNSPKHNALAYASVPKNNIALFGLLKPDGTFESNYEALKHWSEVLDIDMVPIIFKGRISDPSQMEKFLKKESFLGKELIEGAVVKNYNQSSTFSFSPQCFGKFIREEFREKSGSKHSNKKSKLNEFIEQFRTEARWNKAIQHLKELGTLENSPKDIGKLIAEVKKDILEEEKSYIKEGLYRLMIESILRVSVSGIPEWYKNKLIESSLIR